MRRRTPSLAPQLLKAPKRLVPNGDASLKPLAPWYTPSRYTSEVGLTL